MKKIKLISLCCNQTQTRSAIKNFILTRFSQLIHDKRAVKSGKRENNKIFANLQKVMNLPLVFQWARSALISPRKHFSTYVRGS